jgi:hypothetical protein
MCYNSRQIFKNYKKVENCGKLWGKRQKIVENFNKKSKLKSQISKLQLKT